MTTLYIIPNWFSGYDIALEIVFALVTALVAFYSFKIYSLSGQRESKLFGIGFSLITLSYALWAIINFSIMTGSREGVTILEFERLSWIYYFSLYLHIIFFLMGLVTLAYMTLKFKSTKLYLLISALALLEVLGAFHVLYSFYITAAILLTYISAYYFSNYLENRNPKTLLILIAFVFILFSSLDFAIFNNPRVQYVVAHVLTFLAYIFILVSLIMIVKKSLSSSMGLLDAQDAKKRLKHLDIKGSKKSKALKALKAR